jgi:hypothetical protein
MKKEVQEAFRIYYKWPVLKYAEVCRTVSGAAVAKDKIIVITGVDNRRCRESKIFVYEPLKDKCHDLGEVQRKFMPAGVTSVGEKFYVLGGSDLENTLFQCLAGTIVSRDSIKEKP